MTPAEKEIAKLQRVIETQDRIIAALKNDAICTRTQLETHMERVAAVLEQEAEENGAAWSERDQLRIETLGWFALDLVGALLDSEDAIVALERENESIDAQREELRVALNDSRAELAAEREKGASEE